LFRWSSPLGHLDAQLFYDMVCCETLWENFSKVLDATALDTSSEDPSDPKNQAFLQVLGLACIDPWKNMDRDDKDHAGFRHLLQKDKNAPDRFGFKLTEEQKTKLHGALNRPGVLDALQDVAMCWQPASKSMLLRREEYKRLQPIEFPPGWIDFTKR